MDATPFLQWKAAKQFNLNTNVTLEECKYVVLLRTKDCFNLEKDLQNALKLNKKHLSWFLNKFRQHLARVVYADIYSQIESRHFGPIYYKACFGIVRNLYEKEYGPHNTTIVAPTWLLRKVWPEKVPYNNISPETFRDWLIA